ncbi:MAG TPA: response regulator [Noviherbaspirillum sp.]|uniref:response regulator n=1 Tax=Noviherbaspirillum sp. TaxID=1926288 RepID=UPI002D66FDAA|nr:response regulator [Noviherbaspirillum sp.]HYD97124.1 response regulator [Noviherbaspirillum sp.]
MNTSTASGATALLQRYPLRVLVVEDNRDLAKLFCDLLEVMGCVTEATFSGRAALESAKANAPDLVFCDLRLPGGMSGYEVAERMRADEALAHIPLIAVSGYAEGPERERALEAGFLRVFDKPVKFAQMMEVLKEYGKE